MTLGSAWTVSLQKRCPCCLLPLLQKYIRLKRIKVNGKGSKRDVRLNQGDLVQLYINDEFFERPSAGKRFSHHRQPHAGHRI